MGINFINKSDNYLNIRFYRGWSMKGTFCTGDCLFLDFESLDSVRAGDVVVFLKSYDRKREMVHRVVAVSQDGLVTRGDNNTYIDSEKVKEDRFVGKVTHYERKGKVRKIRSGWRGFLWAKILHGWIHIYKAIRIISMPFYAILLKSGFVSWVWHPDINKIKLKTEKGTLIKYSIGGQTAAQWWPEIRFFDCRKPYDLIIRCPVMSLKKDKKLIVEEDEYLVNVEDK